MIEYEGIVAVEYEGISNPQVPKQTLSSLGPAGLYFFFERYMGVGGFELITSYL